MIDSSATSTEMASILIVDGDVVSRHVISDYLRHCGYNVVEAAGTVLSGQCGRRSIPVIANAHEPQIQSQAPQSVQVFQRLCQGNVAGPVW